MYFFDGVYREIIGKAGVIVMMLLLISAEIWRHRKTMKSGAEEAAKRRVSRRFKGRLALYALGVCVMLAYGAYLWQGIVTEDIGSFVGKYEESRSKRREFGRRYVFVAENGARYTARLQSRVLYDQMGSIGFEQGKEYRIYFHRRSDIIVGIEETEE